MDPLLGRLQRALQGRYAVEQELGRGGMATVFLGHDLRLERRVAIKVFEQDGGLIAAGERFLREIRIAAQLQHPNILPVHDSGEGEGLVYYIMPYVAGGSLRERLEREGPLPVADAVRIGREVAEALDHAHRAGIVHRDIKPDNIMLADGVAVVADFGIARAIEQGGGRVTETGLAIGTPTYMSPEQAAASPQVDGRTDLYALGCVIYEMLAGQPPFGGPTAQVVMARQATDAPPPLQTVRTVPPGLETAIRKALAKLPGDRWATGKAMAQAISTASATSEANPTGSLNRSKWRVAAAVLVTLLGAVLVLPRVGLGGGGVAAADAVPVQSVAVIPIVALGDTGLTAYADGFTEAVIGALVRIEELRVPASNRVFALRGREEDPQAVGRELGTETVITGTLQEAEGTLRLIVQLVSVDDGTIRATSRFQGTARDLFAMQDSVTTGLADVLRPRLSAARRAELVRGERTHDTTAYRLYLEARYLTVRPSKENLDRAEALLTEALGRDSLYADAWAGLADIETWRQAFDPSHPAERSVRWRQAVERAIELDSLNGLAYDSRGLLRWGYDWDFDGAERDHREAVRLAPGNPSVLADFGIFLSLVRGQGDSALIYKRRALAIDSTLAWHWAMVSYHFVWNAPQLDSAIAYARRAVAVDSTWYFVNWVLMNAYHDQGHRAAADSAAERLVRIGAESAGARAMAARYYARSGNIAGARRMVQQVEALATRQYVSATTLGGARLAVGDREGALARLEEAIQQREFSVSIGGDVQLLYRPLVGDPRFEAMIRRIARPPAVWLWPLDW